MVRSLERKEERSLTALAEATLICSRDGWQLTGEQQNNTSVCARQVYFGPIGKGWLFLFNLRILCLYCFLAPLIYLTQSHSLANFVSSMRNEWTLWNKLLQEKKTPTAESKTPHTVARSKKWFRLVLLAAMFAMLLRPFWEPMTECVHFTTSTVSYGAPIPRWRFSPLESRNNDYSTSANGPKEIFEVYMPPKDFGTPLYNQTLLSTTFASSWGHPAVVKYTAPAVNFTQVVLVLDTVVDGVQYDRLAHLYLSGVPLWRTSTIEPGGTLAHSSTSKDLTLYASVFREDGELMFQLDNLMTSRLTGAFNITLTAYYYDAEPGTSLPKRDSLESLDDVLRITDIDDDLYVPGSKRKLFEASEEADRVITLVKAPDGRPPLRYLPDHGFDFKVQKLNHNTTRVKLQLFASGNAEEEFWYSNVLDEFKDIFASRGHYFAGHGSCRVAHVFVNGIRVATATPYPVIYTGGISPALWSPVVAAGAFDVRALEVELTPLLPFFWESSGAGLKVVISNCLDDDLPVGVKPSSIGQNWITTGNLVTWEDASIVKSSGELISVSNTTNVSSFGIAPPFAGLLNQIVKANYKNQIDTALSYVLSNGSTVDIIAEVTSHTKYLNNLLLTSFGDKQSVISIPDSKHSFALLDNDTVLSQVNYTHKYPLILSLNTGKNPEGEISYAVNITREFEVSVNISGNEAAKFKNVENGTSTFFLNPNGNHGFGTVEHNLTVLTQDPLPEGNYSRHLIASNGTVIEL
ncbi:unnamed protein product [Kuraishia capsulata CBS 1993]|uniref:Peptide N-acetyl-beta-D-glucosaminyl asparaginase amidase A N-terminal domain-containing protein n=1 Tax=Kuraishia capsulata CBS 1993 TaxID=1382522 RepID=W6MMT4_9ASCO|nr:uncharacterized protein KUCA_T00003909001 [Kuraishia capsulata CBS 1993]CDK27929.1 unnamed protein product [Kuraishia capsulata CBS 1993]